MNVITRNLNDKILFIDNNYIIIRKNFLLKIILLFLIFLILSILIFMRYFILHGDYVNITIFVIFGHITNYIFSLLINKKD